MCNLNFKGHDAISSPIERQTNSGRSMNLVLCLKKKRYCPNVKGGEYTHIWMSYGVRLTEALIIPYPL